MMFLEGVLADVLSLGWFPVFLIVLFTVSQTVCVTADRRRENQSAKWFVFMFGFLTLIAFITFQHFNFGRGFSTLFSLWFLKSLGVYLGIGLLYSFLEFALDVRRAAQFYGNEWLVHFNGKAESWEQPHRGNHGTFAELYADAVACGKYSPRFESAREFCWSFVKKFSFKNQIIQVVVGATGIQPVAQVNKAELAKHIVAWTMFWPFYMLSLVLGDLLAQFFRLVAHGLVKISVKFVHMSFLHTFDNTKKDSK